MVGNGTNIDEGQLNCSRGLNSLIQAWKCPICTQRIAGVHCRCCLLGCCELCWPLWGFQFLPGSSDSFSVICWINPSSLASRAFWAFAASVCPLSTEALSSSISLFNCFILASLSCDLVSFSMPTWLSLLILISELYCWMWRMASAKFIGPCRRNSWVRSLSPMASTTSSQALSSQASWSRSGSAISISFITGLPNRWISCPAFNLRLSSSRRAYFLLSFSGTGSPVFQQFPR